MNEKPFLNCIIPSRSNNTIIFHPPMPLQTFLKPFSGKHFFLKSELHRQPTTKKTFMAIRVFSERFPIFEIKNR